MGGRGRASSRGPRRLASGSIPGWTLGLMLLLSSPSSQGPQKKHLEKEKPETSGDL